MRLMTILGIRPDLVRMSTTIPLLDRAFDHRLVHTGQHFDFQMDGIFYKELGIRNPDLNMAIGRDTKDLSYAHQIGLLMERTHEAIQAYKPEVVMYLGDTNTVVSSIIAAREGVSVVHIEGGMRNFDWRTPEEKNRTMIDNLSDHIFAYLEHHRDNLLAEGIPGHRVTAVGNLIVDVLNHFVPRIEYGSKGYGKYCFATIHRYENMRNSNRLLAILDNLNDLGTGVILPLIPSAKSKVTSLGYAKKRWSNIQFTEPFSFLECLELQQNAEAIITDSGTIQEEACILGVPCMVIRESTERPETIECGATILENDPSFIPHRYNFELKAMKNKSWVHNLGDGNSANRIVTKLKELDSSGFFKESRDIHQRKYSRE